MKKFYLAVAACLMSTTALHADPTGCDSGELVMKFSHVANADRHPKGLAAELFKTKINAALDGKACMEVYPNSTLYTDEKVLEALLRDDVNFAAPSLSLFETVTRQFRLFDLPFMFDDIAAVDRLQQSDLGQKMLDGLQRRGLQGLGFWHAGMKQMSANKPLVMPSDAKGLKFRVQPSDVLVAQMEALGATAQPMAFAEVYGALQSGVVDAQENTWANIYGQKFFEVQDGVTVTNHGLIDYMVVTSLDWWDGLDPEIRDTVSEVLAEVSAERNKAVMDVENSARQSIADAGVEIRELTPEQRQAWVDAMKPVWDKFRDEVGAENIEAARAANNP